MTLLEPIVYDVVVAVITNKATQMAKKIPVSSRRSSKASSCYYCGAGLIWDESIRSVSGKKIPLETDGNPHRCPKRPAYGSAPKQGEEKSPMIVTVERVAKSQEEIKQTLLKLIQIVQTLQTRLETMDGTWKEGSVKLEQS